MYTEIPHATQNICFFPPYPMTTCPIQIIASNTLAFIKLTASTKMEMLLKHEVPPQVDQLHTLVGGRTIQEFSFSVSLICNLYPAARDVGTY